MAPTTQSGSLFNVTDTGDKLAGQVQKIVYADPQSGWAVIRILLPEGNGATAVGSLYGVQNGEELRLTGAWEQDRKFGRQFRVETYMSLLPSTAQGLQRYLGSGLIPGIGQVMAQRLVDRFGLQTLDIIEQQPERLSEVSGIGSRRAGQIRQAWQQQKGVREVLIFLQSHGIGIGHAIKIHREYGTRAIAVIRSNPYKLAEDIYGFGFQTADQIATRLGVSQDAPIRAAAGVLHILGQAESHGHVYLPEDRLVRDAAELLEQPAELIHNALRDLQKTQRIVAESLPPDTGGTAIYRPRLYQAETSVAARLVEINDSPPSRLAANWQEALEEFQQREQIELSPQQRDAVGRSLAENLLIITGGPGTGKTTLIRAVSDLLGQQSQGIVLGAPTGRAAKRLSEATGLEAKTLHRLLEFDPRSLSFQRHQQRPLDADVVIVDETSMLDCSLAWHLLEAIPKGCRLILVGDVDQLPSVGPGRVLADLIDSGRVPVSRLEQVFRQASRSLIVANAHRIRQGQLPQVEKHRRVDFYYIERHQPEEILDTIDQLVSVRIPRSFGFDPRIDIQLLAPMRRGQVGVEQLNTRLQNLLAADSPPVEVTGNRFRQSDRVMQIRNNYDLEVFNGDIGQIVGPSDDDEGLVVDFYGQRITYPISDIDQLVLAYACSIHKAQGSEYPCVVLPLHSQHHIMLQRNLLYTAVTRGRQLVLVVGEPKALARAVRNDRQQIRFTRLTERLGTP